MNAKMQQDTPIQRHFAYILLLVAIILITACQAQVDLSQPPEIHYGEDLCEECGMIISEPRFAAAYYTTNGDARGFDDIGGMAVHHAEHQEDVTQFWVHDYDTEEWIEAERAYYVMSDQLHTPMDYGIVAFSDNDRAQKMASDNNAMVMSFEAVMDSFMEGNASHEHSDS
jgi:copper chaperone NosL